MTREEQLKSCKICNHKKFDAKQGIICGLTNAQADFSVVCDTFSENAELKVAYDAEINAGKKLYPATEGKRLANYLLDRVFFLVFCFIFVFLIGIVLLFVSPESLDALEEEDGLSGYLLVFVAWLIYYTTFEYAYGRTIAKFITKTKVVTLTGEKPSFKTILVRSLCRLIPFEAFTFVGSGKECTGLHDKLAKTRVVDI